MIRHGFSEANNQKLFAGHSDFPLTEIGKMQAERCSEALKDEKIDAVYASDLIRAFDTALPIARAHNLEVIPHKGLREIFAGKWEGHSFTWLDENYPDEYGRVWKTDIGKTKPDGGESVAELYRRVIATLRNIAADNEGKTVCIATHATPIRSVCTAAAGKGADGMKDISWTANASISLFEYENGTFTAVYTSRVDHLKGICTTLPANV